jgi:hypothetical protein
MEKVNRREFLGRSMAAGVASGFVVSAEGSIGTAGVAGPKRPAKDDISLAQWALVREIRDGKWKNSDFPRIAGRILISTALSSSVRCLSCLRTLT